MPRKPNAAQDDKPAKLEVASIKGTSSADVEKLMAEIAGLKEKLNLSEQARSDAEKAALAAAEAQGMLMQREMQPIPTGKTIKAQRVDKYEIVSYRDDGRPIIKPKWKMVELPTFFYRIEMPPVGGMDLKIQEISFYHGTVYEFDIDTLRTVMDMVYRLWDHDRNIHGSDENAYRTPQERRLSMRG